MSRVADALKRASAMQTLSAISEEESKQSFLIAEDPALLITRRGEELGEADELELEEPAAPFTADPASGAPARPKYHAILRNRWVRKMLRAAGVRTSAPVPRCQGMTRMGQPCRGPAMANGLCRLHGGSRHGMVAEKARDFLGRVLPAR